MGTKALSDYMTEGALHTGAVGNTIGDLKFNERYIAISDTHPWKNLADTDAELDEANYPDYVPVMRGVKLYRAPYNYLVKILDESIVSNIVTLTLVAFTSNINILNALSEMLLDYTGGASPTSIDYANWNMCLTTTIALGSVPAGDYTITNINPSARQVSFSYVAPDESNLGLDIYAMQFYPYRVPGNSTKCRHRQQLGKSIMTPDFGTFFNGVSWRDHLEEHNHLINVTYQDAGGTGSNRLNNFVKEGTGANLGADTSSTAIDQVLSARTDSKTYPSGLGAFAYRYVGRYVAP